MRKKLCKRESRLVEHRSKQTVIVHSSAVISCIAKLILLLTVFNQPMSGDLEKNPGPSYTTEKFDLGAFHQGDGSFGETADMQCACNSLFVLCWSRKRKVSIWQ